MGDIPRIGLVSYSNLTSGIGVFARELLDNLPIDSFLSVDNPKGQERGWHPREYICGSHLGERTMLEYMDRFNPEVLLFIETPFNHYFYAYAGERGVRTANIVMHESFRDRLLIDSCDLLICPSWNAWDKAKGRGRVALFLPISLKRLPFREKSGHVFILPVGYGWRNDRRQVKRVVEAFCRLEDPEARLVLFTQSKWPEGAVVDDPRITYHDKQLKEPADLWSHGDIAILPMAYEGYGRMVLEAMASGLPTLTTDADPMNLFQHDPDFLVKPSRRYLAPAHVKNTTYNEVSADALEEKMRWLLTIDTPRYSRMARRQAKAQSWEGPIDYRTPWLEVLEELCS